MTPTEPGCPGGDTSAVAQPDEDIAGVVKQLQHRIDALPAGLDQRRVFLQTYQRTSVAVGAAVDRAAFEDPRWVARWSAVFADFFLAAHDADLSGGFVPRPWRLAFEASTDHHPLVHLLLGMNAHINFDLPQAMLAVINDSDFDHEELLAERRRDHERIDHVLVARVAAEDGELGGRRRIRDRLLTPLNRLSSRRLLRESRRCVWHNVLELHEAQTLGAEAYRTRLAELETVASAKIADLLAPGQVLLRLALVGFGVRLPPR